MSEVPSVWSCSPRRRSMMWSLMLETACWEYVQVFHPGVSNLHVFVFFMHFDMCVRPDYLISSVSRSCVCWHVQHLPWDMYLLVCAESLHIPPTCLYLGQNSWSPVHSWTSLRLPLSCPTHERSVCSPSAWPHCCLAFITFILHHWCKLTGCWPLPPLDTLCVCSSSFIK